MPQLILAAVVACGVLVDSAIGEMPLRPLPLRLASLESLPGRAPVVELPMGFSGDDLAAMYRGMYHQRPVLNGYSGFFPPSYDVMRLGFALRDPRMFDVLTARGPMIIVVDTARDPDGQWAKQVAERPGTTLERVEAGRKVFSLAAGSWPEEVIVPRLPIQSVTANINAERMPLVLDGNLDTCWDSGAQLGVENVTIDLGSTRTVDGVTMTLGSHPLDFPRTLVIETSEDGLTWTARWQGSPAVVALAAAIRHPKEMPLFFELPKVAARMLRLRQVGHDPNFHWLIFELAVHGR